MKRIYRILAYQFFWDWKQKQGYIRFRVEGIKKLKRFNFKSGQNYQIVCNLLSNEEIIYYNTSNSTFFTKPESVGDEEE